MIVVCFLPPPQAGHLHRAIRAPHTIAPAATWDALLSELRRPQCDIAIIDPSVGGDFLAEARLESLERALRTPLAVPVLGYLSVTAVALRTAHTLAKLGASDVLIRGVDDSVDAITAALTRAVTKRASSLLLGALIDQLDGLPATLGGAIRMAFEHPERVRSVSDLANAAWTTRRSLDRWLVRAGLPSARVLLSSARANAAFHLLADGTVRASEAASRVGYTSARSLSRDLIAMTGKPASAVPLRLSRQAFAEALSRRLHASPDRSRVFANGSY